MFKGVRVPKSVANGSSCDVQKHTAGSRFDFELMKCSLIDKIADGIIVVDDQGRIRFANEAAAILFGCDSNDLVGAPFGYPIEDDKTTELSIVREGDDVITVEMRVVEVEGLSEPAFMLSLRDISERKRTDEELEKLVTMLTRTNAELEQFAYVASHDLQEPLRMVIGFVQLLQRRYRHVFDKDAIDFISYAVDGAMRMQTLIKDLLLYSRLGTRGDPGESTECSTVLKEALGNLRSTIKESAAEITHGELPAVAANKTTLVQLFQNLIGNAIKFRGENPPRIHIKAKKIDNFWQFGVVDNGIGIQPEFKERIFLIFQRLHGKAEYPGTGIGLAICNKIVTQYGGQIWVESNPGIGSTFYFTLPQENAFAGHLHDIVEQQPEVMKFNNQPGFAENLHAE